MSSGVIQRQVPGAGEYAIPHTEWLSSELPAIAWSRNPTEALVFQTILKGGGNLDGYERAWKVAERLTAAGDPCHAVLRGKPDAKDPPMPAGFYSSGRKERTERHEWREGKPNCGVD